MQRGLSPRAASPKIVAFGSDCRPTNPAGSLHRSTAQTPGDPRERRIVGWGRLPPNELTGHGLIRTNRRATVGADRVEASSVEADAGADLTSPGTEPAAPAGEPHDMRVVVWDTPAAVERGKRFAVRVGVACSSKCAPAGWRRGGARPRRRETGDRRPSATSRGPAPTRCTTRRSPWSPRTPRASTPGEAAALTGGLAVAHTGGSACFGVRVVSAPACLVTVRRGGRGERDPGRRRAGRRAPVPGRHRRARRGGDAGAGRRVQALTCRERAAFPSASTES